MSYREYDKFNETKEFHQALLRYLGGIHNELTVLNQRLAEIAKTQKALLRSSD